MKHYNGYSIKKDYIMKILKELAKNKFGMNNYLFRRIRIYIEYICR